MDAKEGLQLVTDSANWGIKDNNGTQYDTSDGSWYSVHDDIFVEDNWKLAAPGTERLTGVPAA